MKKIYFRNRAKFDDLKVVAYNGNESIKDEISITGVDSDADFVVDFDDDRYDHIEFTDGNNKTSKVYTGSFNIGVEYKKNGELGRYLTYLFSNDITSTGRVESFELTDETNLYYRSDKSKKICVFVPSTYDNETPHDILYFFDAQNLFSNVNKYTNNGDPYGSWQLDVVISELHRQYGKNIIVVGIDNADEYRSHELFMSPQTFGKLSELATSIPNDNFSKGYLDDLSQFIVNTLHPFVREKYCVKEDSIGIGGSSMGGIAAFYCGLREQGFYKYVLSYSPAFALYEPISFDEYFKSKGFAHIAQILPSIHIYCGGGDPLEAELLPQSKATKTALENNGYPKDKIFETYDEEKMHNEESWRLILCDSFSKIFDL